jgi:outer membrane protein assembly factor BamE (lipoprotein component of BamABCDE complex)
MKRTFILCMIFTALSNGCGPMKGFNAAANRDKIQNISVGMTKEQVKQIVGKPYKTEVYGTNEVWFYITEWKPDGRTTNDEMTPLVFDKGSLIGWGQAFLVEQTKRYEISIKQSGN